MRIHPYLTVVQGQKQDVSRRLERRQTETGVMAVASGLTESGFRDLVEVVSLENKRALTGAPPGDLGAASRLLERLMGDIGRMNRSELRNLHRLEGLVQVYTP